MMRVKPKITGLIPQQPIVINLEPGKPTGISDIYKVELQLTLSGVAPVDVGVRLEIYNADLYTFPDGTNEKKEFYKMTALTMDVKQEIQVRNVRLNKSTTELVLLAYAWDVNGNEKMADGDGVRIGVSIIGGIKNFAKLK